MSSDNYGVIVEGDDGLFRLFDRSASDERPATEQLADARLMCERSTLEAVHEWIVERQYSTEYGITQVLQPDAIVFSASITQTEDTIQFFNAAGDCAKLWETQSATLRFWKSGKVTWE